MKFNETADIFEVGVRIERHAVELYVGLFGSVRSSRARELFSVLAAAEEKHLGQFRLLLEKTAGYEPCYVYPGEYELFVDGMASRALEAYHDRSRPLITPSPVEAIRSAIELEKGLAAFYAVVASQVAQEHRPAFASLIAEEEGHRRRLEELLADFPPSPVDGPSAE